MNSSQSYPAQGMTNLKLPRPKTLKGSDDSSTTAEERATAHGRDRNWLAATRVTEPNPLWYGVNAWGFRRSPAERGARRRSGRLEPQPQHPTPPPSLRLNDWGDDRMVNALRRAWSRKQRLITPHADAIVWCPDGPPPTPFALGLAWPGEPGSLGPECAGSDRGPSYARR